MHLSATDKHRICFAALSLFLLGVEIIIGVFVHDRFVRPYLGDTLVVILLYTIVRVVIPDSFPWLSAVIFGFAVLVEISQIFPLCDVLHIQNRLIRVLMGTSFAWADIVAYFAGCLLTAGYDFWLEKKKA